jgi:hypothetical protein
MWLGLMQKSEVLLVAAIIAIFALGIVGSKGSYIYAVVTGQCRACPAPASCDPAMGHTGMRGLPALSSC